MTAMNCPPAQPDVTLKTPLAMIGTETSLIEFSSDESRDEDDLAYLSSSLSTLRATPSFEKASPRPLSVAARHPAAKVITSFNPLALAAALGKVRQTTTLKTYIEESDHYLSQLRWPSAMAIGAFTRGLNPAIATALKKIPNLHRLSYADVKCAALCIEHDLPTVSSFTESASMKPVLPSPSTASVSGMKVQERNLSPSTDASPNVQDQPTSEALQRKERVVRTLIQLIPARFKHTPGLEKPVLWHCAVKYINEMTSTSFLTPFDVEEQAEASDHNKEVTRNILVRMTPAEYRPEQRCLDMAEYTAVSATNYIRQYLSHGKKHGLTRKSRKSLGKTQRNLQAVLDANSKTRKVLQPKSPASTLKRAQAALPTPKPTPKPTPESTLKPSATATQNPAPKLVTHTPVTVSKTTPKQTAKPTPATDHELVARRTLKNEFYKTASKGQNWGNSNAAIALAETKIRSLTIAVNHLKALMPKNDGA